MGIATKIKQIISKFWIMLFPIISYFFYGYIGISDKFSKALYFLIIPVVTVLVYKELLKKKQKNYSNIVRLLFFLTICSMLLSYIFWDQSLILSYRATAVNFGIIFFFYLKRNNPDISFIEKVIGILCITYLIAWSYGISQAPKFVVGIPSEFDLSNERGFYRIQIYGCGILELSFFLAINKFKETKSKIWMGVFFALFIIIVLHLTRQVIVLSFFFGLYFILKGKKHILTKLVLLAVVFFLVSSIDVSKYPVLDALSQLTKNQIDQQNSGEEYIRFKEYKYFFTDFSKNVITDIFGNGVFHSESNYGKKVLMLASQEKYYAVDVGYADIFITLGALGLFFFLMIFYKVIKQKVPPQYEFAKIYIVYLFFINFGSSYIFFNVVLFCICLYILEKNITSPEKERKATEHTDNQKILQ